MADITNYVMCLKIVQGRARVSVCARLEGSRRGKLQAALHCCCLLAMASLVDAVLEGKTCDALRKFLRNNGLHTSGKKAVLIQR